MNQLSYSRNTEEYSFIYDTIGSRIRHWSQTQPNKTAIAVHMDQEKRAVLTFGELYDKAVKLAKYYLSLGVKPGDRIAVFVYNSPEWLVASVACSLAGAVAVNSFTFTADADLEVVRGMGCKVLIADMRFAKGKAFFLSNIEKFKKSGLALNVILVEDQEASSTQYGVSFDQVSNVMPDDLQLPDEIDPEQITTVFQTSGSTGIPKFVPYSHIKLLNNLHCLYAKMGVANEDIFFSDRPMAYMAGYPMSPIVTGCTFVTLNSQTTVRDGMAGNVCAIVKAEKVSCGYFPPYLIHDLDKLKLSSPEEIPSFKSIITSGQRLSKKLLQRFQDYAIKPCMGYGSTEVGWATFAEVSDLPDVDDDIIATALPGMEIKIADEDGHVVPINTLGEICVRDVYMVGKYLKLSGSFVSCLDENGWFHSGDIGYMANDGKNFCIQGRTVEIIKRSSIKIFPASVETILYKHPAIAEVVVVGIPNERLYEEVCACVTVRNGKDLTVPELEAFGVEQFRPEASHDGMGLMPGLFFILDSFPRLPSQKVNRREVAEIAKGLAKNIPTSL